MQDLFDFNLKSLVNFPEGLYFHIGIVNLHGARDIDLKGASSSRELGLSVNSSHWILYPSYYTEGLEATMC